MPDISPLSSRRDRQDDFSYDDPPDLAAKTNAAKINAPTIAGVNAPAAGRSQLGTPTLPETPAAKLSARAFANSALTTAAGTTAKPEHPDVTAAKLCALAGAMYGARGLTESKLTSCAKPADACLPTADARLLATTCAPSPAAPAPYKGPSAGPEDGSGITEQQQRAAFAQQIAIQNSVRSNPLSAVIVPLSMAAGSSRSTIAQQTAVADATWNTATSFVGTPEVPMVQVPAQAPVEVPLAHEEQRR
jgi:hypothetical protein